MTSTGKDAAASSARPGDRLDEIVRRFRAPLHSYFSKRVRDRQEADDLVQEIFCRLAARTGEAAPMENAEAYIFQMAANLLRDRARREISRTAADRALAEQSGNSFEEISPERVLLGRRRLAEFRRALTELPERTRAIFLLHRFEELKYAEIAIRLGISTSSVEKHMMDAIRHLVDRLGRE